ncbi:MAG: hypothetical protein HY868_25535 [Chloroflexi bacterium]|nr:hypothetical protein [Chloroflexota bacterium]
MGITRTGGLRNAIAKLTRLANKLEHPEDLTRQLAAAMVAQLGNVVPTGDALDAEPTLMWSAFQHATIHGTHASIGDTSILTNEWKRGAPKNTIGDFLRWMIQTEQGYLGRRRGDNMGTRKHMVKMVTWRKRKPYRFGRNVKRKRARAKANKERFEREYPKFKAQFTEAFMYRRATNLYDPWDKLGAGVNLSRKELRQAAARATREMKRGTAPSKRRQLSLFLTHFKRHIVPKNRNPYPMDFRSFEELYKSKSPKVRADRAAKKKYRKEQLRRRKISKGVRAYYDQHPPKWKAVERKRALVVIKQTRKGNQLSTKRRATFRKAIVKVLKTPGLIHTQAREKIDFILGPRLKGAMQNQKRETVETNTEKASLIESLRKRIRERHAAHQAK